MKCFRINNQQANICLTLSPPADFILLYEYLNMQSKEEHSLYFKNKQTKISPVDVHKTEKSCDNFVWTPLMCNHHWIRTNLSLYSSLPPHVHLQTFSSHKHICATHTYSTSSKLHGPKASLPGLTFHSVILGQFWFICCFILYMHLFTYAITCFC